MLDDETRIVALFSYIAWIALWGGAWALLRRSELSFSFGYVRDAFWSGLGFLIGYYVFCKSVADVGKEGVETRTVVRDASGYWRTKLDAECDYEICLASEMEEEHVPKQSKSLGIGRAHCLVLDTSAVSMEAEARVWVWLETDIKPKELEGYNSAV